ncbi:MAG: efflux RND transporter permease subunit [Spirochaetales bacterium]|nr:efflux RND transporter permease subunit [Spirochaetales bacterium]
MNITEVSVRRPVTILIITLMLTGLSMFMAPGLAVELFPTTEFPFMMIVTTYPGASPEEVEESVTSVLEKQVSNVSGLKNISSTSSENSSRIRLEFEYGTDLDEATNDLRDSLERVSSRLPDDVVSPRIMKFNSAGRGIMRIIVSGKESSDTLTRLAEDTIQPRLERIDGVASADLRGGEDKEVVADISLNRLEAYGLTLNSVSQALASQDVLLSGGKLDREGLQYSLRINERLATLDDIRRTIISSIPTRSSSGSVNRSNVIRLEDIADVYLDAIDSGSRVYINGTTSVTLQIMNESDTNTVQVAEAVRRELPEINKVLPKDVKIDILYDNTTMISSILNQVYKSALQGLILAVLILFLFLRNIKSTLVIACSIPVSIFITLGAMYFFNITLNMVSLTGLILGLGMIVDNSIVILENIYKYRERGSKLRSASILGSREMVTAITASTLTTLCVFIPLIIWKDSLEMIGQIFQDMIFTIVISLLISLVVALTLVPALASKYLKLYSRKQRPIKNTFIASIDRIAEKTFTGLERGYIRALNFALKNRVLVLTLVLVFFLAALARFTTMGMEFQPPSSSDDNVNISLTMPVGTSLDRTEAIVQEMRRIIEKNISGYKNLIVTAGSGFRGPHNGEIEITLPPLEEQTITPDRIKEKLEPYLSLFPDARFEFSSGRHWGSSTPIDMEIISSDLALAGKTAAEIRDLLLQMPEIVEPESSLESGAPEYRLKIDKDRAAALGLSVSGIAAAVNSLVDGSSPTSIWMDGQEIALLLRLREQDRDSLPDIESLFILSSSGEKIRLSNLASFEPSKGPEDIERENEKRIIHVTANIAKGLTASEVQGKVKTFITRSYVIPEGVKLDYGGEAEDISRLSGPFIIVLVVAILMVFSVMASLFESFADPFIIFFSIPLLLIGVVLIYTILGQPLSMMSIIGMVVLVGIVVNNGIVLVDYTNLLRRKGTPLFDACLEAGRSRLRPVLMTSLTTILGMVPLGFFPAKGTETIQAIGQTIVGGLFGSTILTLFVTPVMYSLVNQSSTLKSFFRKLARRLFRISGQTVREGE